jgi:hypothetical protein
MNLRRQGRNFLITIPMYDEPRRSNSGKAMTVGSTRGNRMSKRKVEGQNVRYTASVFYYPAATPKTKVSNTKKRRNKRAMAPRRLRRRRQR